MKHFLLPFTIKVQQLRQLWMTDPWHYVMALSAAVYGVGKVE